MNYIMRSHRNLHHLLGIQHSEVMPKDNVIATGGKLHHDHMVALGMGIGLGLSAGGGDGGDGGSGTGLYASGKGLSAGCNGCGLTSGGGLASGGKLSKIGQAFNKAFNPKKNGVANEATKVGDQVANEAIKVGDQIKTGVVHTYNQAYKGTENVADKINQGWHKTFNPKTGDTIVSDLKTGARYIIPAATAAIGGLAGTVLTGGNFYGGIAGSAAGAYAGFKADQALGLANSNDFKGVPNANGKGIKKRKSKNKSIKSDSDSSSETDSEVEGGGMRRRHKKAIMRGGTIKDTLDKKVWKKIPEVFHKPLEDIGVASLEYAGFKIPPKKKLQQEDKQIEEGKGFKKSSKSKTRKNELDFITHKSDPRRKRKEKGTGIKWSKTKKPIIEDEEEEEDTPEDEEEEEDTPEYESDNEDETERMAHMIQLTNRLLKTGNNEEDVERRAEINRLYERKGGRVPSLKELAAIELKYHSPEDYEKALDHIEGLDHIPPLKKPAAMERKYYSPEDYEKGIEGTGVKGSRSKTRKGRKDYETHKGDKDYHRKGHDEVMPEGGKLKKHKKGSPEALAWGAKMKEMRMKKKGMTGGGIDNNSPHSGAIRVSPFQNF